MNDWQWDETLYGGSAPHYREGRLPYPADLPERLGLALRLTGSERLLDIGCGPGNLTIPLAAQFAEAVGVDADPGMIAEARRGAPDVTWLCHRAEQIPGELGRFDVVTFGQSFHWMDRTWLREGLRDLVVEGGAVVHLNAITHAGTGGGLHPRPPHERIQQLVNAYLGETRRAGRGLLTHGLPDDENQVLPVAGFVPETVVTVEVGREWERSEREVASAVLSLSSSAPALFGDRFGDFERDLRALLSETSDGGWFTEKQGDVEFTIWRAAASGWSAGSPAE